LAVKPLGDAPLNVVHREGLDLAQVAERRGPERRPDVRRHNHRLSVVGVTDCPNRGRKSLYAEVSVNLPQVYPILASVWWIILGTLSIQSFLR
jgi:hypothetical protein